MSIQLDLQNDEALAGVPEAEQFSLWVTAALQQDYDSLEQTIRIVDEAESQALNAQYRGRDSSTNVLSFPADIPHIDYQCLGDLVICAPVVAREAAEQNKADVAHWAHLVIHGMLHLQGFDHENHLDADKMEALEVKILSTLGYRNPYNDE
ncbi:MAG: rRNA maturation RNase YbeY [Gammaproteobacteria bacterium]|nr:rRNA maturation RNase YbeY [Gammaproteobacteria bacterium]